MRTEGDARYGAMAAAMEDLAHQVDQRSTYSLGYRVTLDKAA